MKLVRMLVVALTIAAAACLPLSTAAAGTVASPGTNIGNAGMLTGSNSDAGDMTAMSDDWWVIYLPAPGVAPNINIDNTSAPGLCDIQAQVYTTEGTGQRVLQQTIIPGDLVTLTDPLTGLSSDRYFVELTQSACSNSTATTPYTISLPTGTATATPSVRTGYVPGTATIGSAWPSLQGDAYYTGTLGSVSWYVLDKKPDSARATIRVQNTTLFFNASTSCPGFTATLYAGTSPLTQVSSIGMFDNEATTLDIPGRLSGDPTGRYYLKLTSTGCDLLNTTTYSVEPEPAAEWPTPSQALPFGPRRTAAAGPLGGAVTYGAVVVPGAVRWAFFRATGAVTVRVHVPLGSACPVNAGVYNSAGGRVASSALRPGRVAGLRLAKAGTYYVSLSDAGKCQVSTLIQLAGGVRGPVLRVLNPVLKAGVVHRVYRCTIGVAGGRKPYTFTALTPLPPGLRLSRTGLVTGTPAKAGRYTFMVTVTDAARPRTMPVPRPSRSS